MNLHYNDLIAYLKQNMIARFPEIENIDEYIQKRLKPHKFRPIFFQQSVKTIPSPTPMRGGQEMGKRRVRDE